MAKVPHPAVWGLLDGGVHVADTETDRSHHMSRTSSLIVDQYRTGETGVACPHVAVFVVTG